MKELSLVIDITNLNLGEEDKKSSPLELFIHVLYSVLRGYSQQMKGLQKFERYQVYEIEHKLKEALNNKADKIKFEDTTFGFLKKIFTESKLNPNELLELIEKNIDAVTQR